MHERLLEQIVDLVCAYDPEFGGHTSGEQEHSHDPEHYECYWAYLVGPDIKKLLEAYNAD